MSLCVRRSRTDAAIDIAMIPSKSATGLQMHSGFHHLIALALPKVCVAAAHPALANWEVR
jgi:hypothetical protein